MLRSYLAIVLGLTTAACGYVGPLYELVPGDEVTAESGDASTDSGMKGVPPDAGTMQDAPSVEDTAAPNDTGVAVDTGTSSASDSSSDDAASDATVDAAPDTSVAGPPDTGALNDTGILGDAPATSGPFTITGTLTGLAAGASVVLQDDGGGNLTLTANGTFVFGGAPLPTGSAYAVTVLTQPATPNQTCTVTNGTGTVGSANVVVTVACTTRSFTVGGTVAQLLPGASVVLEDNGGNALTVSANGAFTFTAPVASGAAYAVTVLTQPSSQTCNVGAGTGTVGAGAITSVVVTCGSGVTVGGTISGLSAGDTLALADNGGSTLFVTSNGAFAFPTTLATGASYDVTIVSNPAIPVNETCTVTKGTGTVGTTNVTSVAVACKPSVYAIGGAVTGLAAGDAVVLQDNAGDNLSVTSVGPFTFATSISSGMPYAVTVLANPTSPTPQACVVAGGSGNVGSGNVTTVTITCANTFTIGVALGGLTAGNTVVLQDNGADNLSLAANGTFVFATAVAAGQPYDVTVLTQPSTGVCQVTSGSGTVGTSNVTVAVACSSAGSTVYSTPGTYTFTVPPGVTSISAVVIGAGGVGGQDSIAGGGGALAYKNNIPVTVGQQLPVVVGPAGAWFQMSTDVYEGGPSSFAGMIAGGGAGGNTTGSGGTASGGDVNNSGGNGGMSCYPNAGGGGAAGYTENGQNGGNGTCSPYLGANGGNAGDLGASGGAGGLFGGSMFNGGSGGGTGLFGTTGGMPGADGTASCEGGGIGGTYGGGAGSGGCGYFAPTSTGGNGAVRIVWPGSRTFPTMAGLP